MISSDSFIQALLSGATELEMSLSEAEVEVYRAHYALLLEHKARAGLTSLTDPAEIAVKHYLDSLSCLKAYDFSLDEQVIDLGSGGGFPGMVLAIARGNARFLLADSSAKRTAFLRVAAEALQLSNVTVITARAEALGREAEHRERYDLVLSRALAPLPVLLEYGLPLARLGGHALAMKGPEAEAELAASARALKALGGRVAATHKFALPQGFGRRTLVLIEKVSPTPERYPRRPGLPSKRPIL